MTITNNKLSSETNLLLIIGFLHMLSVSMGSAIIPAYVKDLGGSDALVGYVISVFYLIRGTFTILAGGISDRIGRRRPVIVSLALFSISQLLYSFCQKPWHVPLCIVVQAVAAGIYWPSILSYIADTSTPSSHAKNISRFFVLVGLGGFLGSWTGGHMAEIYSPRVSYLLGCMAFSMPLIVSVCLAEEARPRETVDKVTLRSLFSTSGPLFLLILIVGSVFGISMLIGLVATALVPNWGRYMGFPKLILISMSICAFSAVGNGVATVLWMPYVLLPLLWGAVMTGEVSWITYIQSESSAKAIGMTTGLLRGTMDLIALLYSTIFGLLSNTLDIGTAFIFSALGILIIFEVTRRYFRT